MPALSADRRDGDEGSCQGAGARPPLPSTFTGPIEAAGEPDQVDIALPAAEAFYGKSRDRVTWSA
jgi:hypothetical protein